jgi:agmatine deiminase
MAELLDVPRFDADMVLEGGAVEVNGDGLVLTTTSCLLNPNRNPDLDRTAIENALCTWLGVAQLLWLEGDMAGDDTDGHIDNLARFVTPETVVAAVEADPTDVNYAPLQDNLERLRSMTTRDGTPLRILPLPMPEPYVLDGIRMPASYANFLIGNRVVLVPQYGGRRDAEALAVLQDLFPTRKAVGFDCTQIIWGLGGPHCLSQQVPGPPLRPQGRTP